MARLLDTSVFVELERRGLRIEDLAIDGGSEPVGMASITVSELLAGAYRADSPGPRLQRESFVESVVDAIPVLPFDLQVARIYARLWADLMAAGQQIGVQDTMIAATALTHEYAVVTQNVRDFERVPGLVVRKPIW